MRSKLAKRPQDYRYHSDAVYRTGKATAMVDPRALLKMLGGSGRYKQFIHDGLNDGHKEEYYEVADQRLLGDQEFGEELTRSSEEPEPKKRRALTAVVKELAAELEVDLDQLRAPNRGWQLSQQRTMIAYVLVRRGGYAAKDVAQYFKRDATTISSTLSRYEGRVEKQPELRRQLKKLARII